MEQELSAQEKAEALTFLNEDLRQHLAVKRAELQDLLFQRNCEVVRYEVFKASNRMEHLPEIQHEIREIEERALWELGYRREQEEILRLYERKLETIQRGAS